MSPCISIPQQLNLTNHVYWNLGGAEAGSILDHRLQPASRRVLEFDGRKIPTGRFLEVVGTPFDFRAPRAVGSRISEVEGGYDHCYEIQDIPSQEPVFAARLEDARSGRDLEVLTTAPGVQLHTANGLGPKPGPEGHFHGPHQGVCLECRHYPDSPNRPEFPSTLVRPGESYRSVIEFRFFIVDP